MSTKKRALGHHGEAVATAYLEQKGYDIIAQNWRCTVGELDIIARTEEGVLVFVEVRTRRGQRFGTPLESITPKKQAKLVELAHSYLQENPPPHQAWRIDVVGVQYQGHSVDIQHVENAVGW